MPENDVEHLTFAIQNGLTLLTHNPKDYEKLSKLVVASGGKHPGIFLVREDGNVKHTMGYYDIARAIANIEKSGINTENQVMTLNHWQ